MKKKLISLLTALSMTFMLFGSPNIAAADTHTDHKLCINSACGNTAIAADNICVHGEETWTEWKPNRDKISSIPPKYKYTYPTNGTYYLTEDISLLSTSSEIINQINIKSGETLNLCLNGHTITMDGSASSIFDVSGTLNICDCKGGSKLTGVNGVTDGGAIHISSTGTFNMYGGSITENISGNSGTCAGGVYNRGTFKMYGGTISGNTGGGITIGSGVFNMYDGSVSGNTAASGGGIYRTYGIINIYGGEITNNTATSYGGGISSINDNNTTNLYGGTITGNKAPNGGGIYDRSDIIFDGKINISGNTNSSGDAENVLLTGFGTTITIGSNFDTSSTIGIRGKSITCSKSQTISQNVSTDVSAGFFSDTEDAHVEWTDGTLKLTGNHKFSDDYEKDEDNHWHLCSICNTAKNSEAAHTWNSGTVTTAATCTAKGVKTYTCSVCGQTKTEDIAVTAHSYSATWTMNDTQHWHVCSNCGAAGTKTNHSWGSGKVTTPATCTTDGVRTFTCTCGKNKTEPIAKTGHSYGNWTITKDPSLTAAGTAERVCSNNSTHKETKTLPILTDTSVWTKDNTKHVEPTEEATGKDVYKSEYGEIVVVLPKKAHIHTIIKIEEQAATCTTAGNNAYWTCSGCSKMFSDENGNNEIASVPAIPVLEHTEVVNPAVAATCTATGLTEGKHCSVCGAITKTQGIVPKTKHTEVADAAVAATCTETGLTEGKHCSVCNTVTKAQEIVPALNHDFGEWTVAQAATCTTAGTKERICQRGCGEKETDTIPANGHTYIDGICTVCGAIDAEHEHTGGTATCKDKAFCAICGQPYGDLTEHTITPHAAVPETCTTAGNDAYWDCSVCNKIFSDENGTSEIGSVPTIPALEHNYVDGTCAMCGGTDPTYNTSGNATENVQDTAGTNAGLVMDNSLLNNSLDNSDLAEIENGHNFEIVLEVTDIRDSVSSADVAAASSALSSGEEIGVYVDLSLFKIKDGAERTPIHNASGQIGITLTIPESIYASDRTYSMIRVHNGIAENLGGTYDEATRSLTFYTDKFSTYAIAFTASSVNIDSPTIPSTPSNPTAPTTPYNPSTPSAPAVTPAVTETAAKDEEIISDDEPYIEDVSSGAWATEDDGDISEKRHEAIPIIGIAVLGTALIFLKRRMLKK